MRDWGVTDSSRMKNRTYQHPRWWQIMVRKGLPFPFDLVEWSIQETMLRDPSFVIVCSVNWPKRWQLGNWMEVLNSTCRGSDRKRPSRKQNSFLNFFFLKDFCYSILMRIEGIVTWMSLLTTNFEPYLSFRSARILYGWDICFRVNVWLPYRPRLLLLFGGRCHGSLLANQMMEGKICKSAKWKMRGLYQLVKDLATKACLEIEAKFISKNWLLQSLLIMLKEQKRGK